VKAYAEKADLEDYLPAGMTLPSDAEVDRLLLKASDQIDGLVTEAYEVDTTDLLPTDESTAAVLNKAACLQVVYMLTVGEDIEGVGNTQVSVGSFSGKLPGRYSLDAFKVLHNAGLINGSNKGWLQR
jgi:hypothetical protein